MYHMPATGVGGVDLYGENGEGIYRWVSGYGPNSKKIETSIAKDLTPGSRNYILYLPLYNGVDEMEIGVLDGKNLLGSDREGATDGSHPNDLGMIRYANAYEPVIRSILKQY